MKLRLSQLNGHFDCFGPIILYFWAYFDCDVASRTVELLPWSCEVKKLEKAHLVLLIA